MALSGIDPNDPVPGTRRELLFAQGASAGSSKDRGVLFFAKKTSDGSETADTIGDAVTDLDDVVTRYGRRSEARWMYEAYKKADPSADRTIHICAYAEAGGATAATKDFTFVTAANKAMNLIVEWGGETIYVPVADGDAVATIASAVATAITSAGGASWPFTGGAALGVVTCTASNLGPGGDLVLERIRMRFDKSGGTTVTAGAIGSGTGADDLTAAYAQAALDTYYCWVLPCHATGAVTTTDNQIGEGITNVTTQALPTNGKEQIVCIGLVGTQSQASAVATSAGANSVRAFFFHSENNPWTPGMLAAHHAGVVMSQQVAHPSANINGYSNSDATPYSVPAPYSKGDYPTPVEIKAMLNDGVCPVAFNKNGGAYLVRHVTSRSRVTGGGATTDYRAREGHITSAVDFTWQVIESRWNTVKQSFVAEDPKEGEKPLPNVTYPRDVKAMIANVIDDLTSAQPLGLYDGPVLAPDKKDAMKASITVTKATGKLRVGCSFIAVEHLISFEFRVSETGAAY